MTSFNPNHTPTHGIWVPPVSAGPPRNPRRLRPAATARRKYSFEFPPALRQAMSQRAAAYGTTTAAMVTAALTWFADYWYENGTVPKLQLLDPDRLPDVPTSFPRTYAIGVSNDVMGPIDTIAEFGASPESRSTAGSTRSDVIRHAICAFLEAAATASPS